MPVLWAESVRIIDVIRPISVAPVLTCIWMLVVRVAFHIVAIIGSIEL